MVKNMREKWNYSFFTEVGERHIKKGLQNQDGMAYEKKGSVHAMVLLDGIGKSNATAEAMGVIAKKLAKMVCEDFEQIYYAKHVSIKERLLLEIYRVIEKYMDKYNFQKHEYASTLMLVALDDKDGRLLLAHLGDGVILGQGNSVKILSYPENGFLNNQTFVTTADGALLKLRIKTTYIDECSQILLMTDGNNYDIYDKKLLAFFCESDGSGSYVDDRSICRLKKY